LCHAFIGGESLEKSFSRVLAEEIKKATDIATGRLPCDKTYNGVIVEVLFDENTESNDVNYYMYKIAYNNSVSKIRILDGITHAVGDKVRVYVPSGSEVMKYAEVITEAYMSKVKLSAKDSNKVQDLMLTFKNGLGLDSIKTYKLQNETKTVEGVDIDIITKVTFPNGIEVDIENDE
jgi:hypothetical protein